MGTYASGLNYLTAEKWQTDTQKGQRGQLDDGSNNDNAHWPFVVANLCENRKIFVVLHTHMHTYNVYDIVHVCVDARIGSPNNCSQMTRYRQRFGRALKPFMIERVCKMHAQSLLSLTGVVFFFP